MTNLKNTKKALISSVISLLLCLTMLLGTTFAWFTDSVTSSNNIIKSGKLDVQMFYAEGNEDPADDSVWEDASDKAIFNYDKWEPGYVEAKHLKIANIGTLAFNYQLRIVANGAVSKLADVIDVYYFTEATQLTRADVTTGRKLGTLTELLTTTGNIANTVKGMLVSVEDAANNAELKAVTTLTLAFKMQETAGNEYQDLKVVNDFSIELIATQASFEGDSFDADYDAAAPAPEVPAALVRSLDEEELDINFTWGIGGSSENIKLDVGYQFEPTMELDKALNSDYRYWHADFVVYADGTIPAESMALAGYYDAWCQYNNDNWVALTSNVDIAANTEIRLVEVLGTTVNWEDLCEYGNDGLGFQCGAVDLTGANAGTTLTVELRLYAVGAQGECANGGGCTHPSLDCESATGEYITIGKFTYTFPVKDIVDNDVIVVNDAVELQAALDNVANGGKSVINFANDIAGDVIVTQPAGITNLELVINGCGYKYNGSMQIKGNSDNGTDKLVIKNVNFETSNATSASGRDAFIWSYDSSNGTYWRYAHNLSVENCTFTAVEGSAAQNKFVGVKIIQAYNIKVVGCTATNMHSLLQAESCGTDSVVVEVNNCKTINCKNGVSFNNTYNAVVKNSNIESVADGGYGIRHQGAEPNYSLTVENTTIKAFVPVLARKVTSTGYALNFNGTNTLTATNTYGYQVVISKADWDSNATAPSAPTGTFTVTGADSFNVFNG